MLKSKYTHGGDDRTGDRERERERKRERERERERDTQPRKNTDTNTVTCLVEYCKNIATTNMQTKA